MVYGQRASLFIRTPQACLWEQSVADVHASNMAYIVRPTCPMLADEYAIMAISVSDSRLTGRELWFTL